MQLLGRSLHDIEESLSQAGVALERDDMGAVIPRYGVGLFAPTGDVEGVQLGSD